MKHVDCDLCGLDDYVEVHDKGRYGIDVNNVICKNCGLVYVNPVMDEDDIRKLYTEQYRLLYSQVEAPNADYLRQARTYAEPRLTFTAPYVDQPVCKTVLEVGCAEGTFLSELAKRYELVDVHGIEPFEPFVDFGKEKYGLDIEKGFFEELPIPQNTYDVVFLWHVLEHFLSPTKALRNIRNLLVNGGLLIMEMPSVMLLYGSLNYFFQSAHLFTFSPRTVSLLLQKMGFHIVVLEEANSPDYTEGKDAIRVVAVKGEEPAEIDFSKGDKWLAILFHLKCYSFRYALKTGWKAGLIGAKGMIKFSLVGTLGQKRGSGIYDFLRRVRHIIMRRGT